MNFKPKEIHAGLFILILHVVGIVGYLVPALNAYFLLLTPFNLLLTGLLLVYLNWKNQIGGEIYLLAVFIIGLSVEIAGVKTGVLFGEYQYGSTLGFKVMEVPLIIGMNWLVLGYSFGAICKRILGSSKVLSIVLAAFSMVLLDVIIEPIAIRYDYWSWELVDVPLRNYIGWFIVALLVQFLLQRLDLQKLYKFALLVVISQTVFFIMLNLLSG